MYTLLLFYISYSWLDIVWLRPFHHGMSGRHRAPPPMTTCDHAYGNWKTPCNLRYSCIRYNLRYKIYLCFGHISASSFVSILYQLIVLHEWRNQVQTDRAFTYARRSTYVRRSTYDICCIFAVMLFTSIFPSNDRQIWYNSQRIELLILKLITINKNSW